MKWLTALNSRLSRWAMYLAVAGLLGIVGVVVYGVVLRYVFNDAPAYVEQVGADAGASSWRCSARRPACATRATSAWNRWSACCRERPPVRGSA